MIYWGQIRDNLLNLYAKGKEKIFTWNDVADALQQAYSWGAADVESKWHRHPSVECARYGHVYASNCHSHYSFTCADCGELSWERMIYNDSLPWSGDWGGTRYSGYIPQRCNDCGAVIAGNNRRLPTEDSYDKCYQWAVENKKGASHIFYACFHSRIRHNGEVEMLLLDETVFKVVKNYKEFREAWIERMRIE